MSLIKSGYAVLHSTQDADTMVVNTAMSKLERSDVILVGDDTDLLIVALHQCMHTTPSNSLYMFRSGAVLNVRNVIDAPANKNRYWRTYWQYIHFQGVIRFLGFLELGKLDW